MTIIFRIYIIIIFGFYLLTSCVNYDTKVLGDKFCECLEKNKSISDTNRLIECYKYVTNNYKLKFPDSHLMQMDIYLFKNCSEFAKITTSKNGKFSTDKTSIINDTSECKRFLNIKHFYYLTNQNDTTFVEINNNIWTERLNNNTYYSKLKIDWTSACSFQLIFIESNHPYKSKLSKRGDTYNYQIIDSRPDFYRLTLIMKNYYTEFNLYKITAANTVYKH
jgi:hypothetical protein